MPVSVNNVTGDSPEAVAYALMHDVLLAEGTVLARTKDHSGISRDDLLTLYARCLAVVRAKVGSGTTVESGRNYTAR